MTNATHIDVHQHVVPPFWAELNRRDAVAFIHPGHPELALIEGMLGPMVDYPFFTTHTEVQIVLNDILDRYPHMEIILSHAGGFAPYAVYRFAGVGALMKQGSVTAAELLAKLQRFYGAAFTKHHHTYEGFNADEYKAINHGNALMLFLRLAALAYPAPGLRGPNLTCRIMFLHGAVFLVS